MPGKLPVPDDVSERYGSVFSFNDQAFFTWNGTNDELRQTMKVLDQQCADIRVAVAMGPVANFLDVHLSNVQGRLLTRVHHSPNAPPFVLPYAFGHARLMHSNWFRAALVRAVRFCSTVEDFNQERIHIELAFLANGFSLVFVRSRIRQFFIHFDAVRLRISMDQPNYDLLRQKLLSSIDHEQYLFEQNEAFENEDCLTRLYYLYECGPRRQFNREFRRLWNDYFKNDRAIGAMRGKVLFTTKHRYSLNALLAKQKPSSSLLKIR